MQQSTYATIQMNLKCLKIKQSIQKVKHEIKAKLNWIDKINMKQLTNSYNIQYDWHKRFMVLQLYAQNWFNHWYEIPL
jgi:hypothetical protein